MEVYYYERKQSKQGRISKTEKNIKRNVTNYRKGDLKWLIYTKNIKGNKAMIKEERDRLKNKETILDNQLKSLENYTRLCLNNAGLNKMDLGVFKISLRKSESTEITDLSLIPKEFLKYKDPEPNKTEIKKAIKEGREIKGARIIENESLVIK